ncbi:hypothetical protein O3M35_008439 [Rhynocoris fuscipes]|uniref:Uncharacterized protein n=1 Tax=Rhynocoris fuscipes TaxID=488301 RepID=A0AAW1D716_9HEMI
MQALEEYCDSPILNSVGCSNLAECLLNSIKKYKNNIAQIDCNSGAKITFNDIKTKALTASFCLNKAGIKRGDIVAICSSNNIDYCWQILAILHCGACCSLVSPTATPRELIHNLNITKPKAVICENLNDKQLETILERECVQYIWMNDEPSSVSKCKSVSELLEDEDQVGYNRWSGLCPAIGTDPAFICSSSGSTGLPKGVLLTHNNLISMLIYSELFMKKNGTALGLMPFYHAYGLGLMLMALNEGTRVAVLSKFSLVEFINAINMYQVTHLHIVPSLLATLAKNKEIMAENLKSIQEVYTGAGAIITKHQLALKSKLSKHAKLYHSYGMTETTFVVLFAESRYDKPGSSGKLLSGISAKIVSENGDELGEGQIGELLLKGKTIMSGYLNNPEATSEAIDQHRWLHTGDLAYFDNDGYFYIVDRIKEMIKYQGYQVSPTEIEMVLLAHPGVSQVAVVGIPHETYGELPRAYVVRDKCGHSVTEEELQNLIKDELSPYKQLRGGVCFVGSLPNSPTGKIQKKILKSNS